MVDNAKPSIDPTNNDSLTGTFREVLKKFLQSTDDMLPAQVLAHDRTTNRVRVKPMVQLVTTEGERVERAEIPSIPVLNLGGGGFFLNFNLPAGSLGWIKANDRDISLFLQGYSEAAPNTRRLHGFEDALFIPDTMTGYTVDPEDSEAMVIQNLDGSVRISLNDTRIKITTPQLNIVTGTSTVTIIEDAMTITTANVQVNGALTATGDITSSGGDVTGVNVTGTAEVTVGAVPLSGHKHTGVTTGPGVSGGPIP